MPTIYETVRKVREFEALPSGWHFGEGVDPPHQRIEQAVKLLQYASQAGVERANAFPGVAGQVEITFYNGDRMLELTLESDDSITIAEDHGREQVFFEENCSRIDAKTRLEDFGQTIWASSDLFTANITTRNVGAPVSQARLLTSEQESRFPLLIVTAQEPTAVRFVLISGVTTTSSLEARTFTGQYLTQFSHPDIGLRRRQLPVGTYVTGTFIIGAEAVLGARSRRSA